MSFFVADSRICTSILLSTEHNMRKKYLSLLFAVMLTVTAMAQNRIKYVFYFIGDGMGVNQVNVTETYLAALKGQIGFEPILMSCFPVVGLVNTYSGTNGVLIPRQAVQLWQRGTRRRMGLWVSQLTFRQK